MFCADFNVTLVAEKCNVISALNCLKINLNQYNKTTGELSDKEVDEYSEAFQDDINAYIDSWEEFSENDEVRVSVYPLFTLSQCIALTDDIEVNLFMELATIMKDGCMEISIEWEGPSDSHRINWDLEAGVLRISFYDYDSDWECDDEDDESSGVERSTVSYRWVNNKWCEEN